MRLTAVSYTFVLVCAFLSPTNPDTASCSHFLPCLPNPRTSPYRNGCAGACALKRRETLVADADLIPLHTRQVKVSRNMPKVDGAEARLARRKLRAVLGKDQTAGEVHAWCLEQNERLKSEGKTSPEHLYPELTRKSYTAFMRKGKRTASHTVLRAINAYCEAHGSRNQRHAARQSTSDEEDDDDLGDDNYGGGDGSGSNNSDGDCACSASAAGNSNKKMSTGKQRSSRHKARKNIISNIMEIGVPWWQF